MTYLRIELDPDCVTRFVALADHLAATHTAMGLIVDESLIEAPREQAYTDAIYLLYSDLYYQSTGERVSPRTVRWWRDCALKFSKHDLLTFEVLPDSIRLEAVKLADAQASLDSDLSPVDICQIAKDEMIRTVPALRKRILGEQAEENSLEPELSGWLWTLRRRTLHWPPGDERHARFDRIVAILERMFEL